MLEGGRSIWSAGGLISMGGGVLVDIVLESEKAICWEGGCEREGEEGGGQNEPSG